MCVRLSVAIILVGLTADRSSIASSIAVDPGSGGFENASYGANVTIGWGFTLTTSLTVTDLGYFDGGDPGLVDLHPVAIWDTAGNLLASATVPSGTGGTLVSGFRFIPIVPVVLGPGTFSIGGYANMTSPDPLQYLVPSITTIGGLSFGTANLFSRADTLTRPTTQAEALTPFGYFGPDFLAGTLTQIPEPGAIGTTLLGLAFVMRILIKARKVLPPGTQS
jgi:hypothetical protein